MADNYDGMAVGVFELDNLVACFVALDAASKAANVKIQSVERNRLKSGACVKMRGSVSDVNAAMEVALETAKPLGKIVSGGELSRIMLALKAILADRDQIETLIFDEIDTGISGSVGRAVAKKLAQISLSHQVMCVTHLPQIAAMASSQFFIEKKVIDGSTVTLIDNLQREGMVKEIARLSGSLGVSENALAAADELKRWCEDYVKEISH